MKISTLIFLSIFIILLLFSLATYINFNQGKKVIENADALSVSSAIVRQSNQLQRNILYMERGLRGYMVTRQDYFLQAFDSSIAQNEALNAELTQLIKDDTKQYQQFKSLKDLYESWLSQIAIPLKNNSAIKQLNDTFNIESQMGYEETVIKNLQIKFREFVNAEYAKRQKLQSLLQESEQKTKFVSILLTVLSIIMGMFIAFMLARHISARIKKMVGMANSIAGGNYNVHVKNDGNDELSELTSSLNHMAKMLSENISLLQRKNVELDQFAHIVSHDLKAPLRGIENVLTWIKEDHSTELSPQVHEYLNLIKGRVHRAENMIQAILAYARIGRDTHAKQTIQFEKFISDIISNLPTREGIQFDVQKNVPKIETESLPLQQVFTNLISNAIKYHDKNDGYIKIYYAEEGTNHRFFIEDNGPGIDKVYHQKIFQIFQTLQERDSFESTGVGLSIVKKILDDRHQTINISSGPGQGTIFSFTWNK